MCRWIEWPPNRLVLRLLELIALFALLDSPTTATIGAESLVLAREQLNKNAGSSLLVWRGCGGPIQMSHKKT